MGVSSGEIRAHGDEDHGLEGSKNPLGLGLFV